MTEAERLILEGQGATMIESALFSGTEYGITQDGIVVDSGKYGRLAINKEHIQDFIGELWEISQEWVKRKNMGR